MRNAVIYRKGHVIITQKIFTVTVYFLWIEAHCLGYRSGQYFYYHDTHGTEVTEG